MGAVYFFSQVHELGRGITKVGWAADPRRRLSEIQVGNPYLIEVAALFPGVPRDEKQAHMALASYRLRGEWFALQGGADAIEIAAKNGETLKFALAGAVARLQKEIAKTVVSLGTPLSRRR